MGEMADYYRDRETLPCRVVGPRLITFHGPPSMKPLILKALEDGTYWINGKRQVVPLMKINKTYARNIRAMIRRRLKPEEYEGKPLYVALGRVRRR